MLLTSLQTSLGFSSRLSAKISIFALLRRRLTSIHVLDENALDSNLFGVQEGKYDTSCSIV